MKKLSIKLRLTIWYTVLMIIIVSVVLGIIYIASENVTYGNSKKQLKNVVMTIANEASDKKYVSINNSRINNVYIALYTKDNTLVNGVIPDGYSDNVKINNKDFQSVIINNDYYYIYDKKVKIDGTKYYVRGFVKTSSYSKFMKNIVKISYIALPILILLIAAGGYNVSRKAFIPLERMNKKAGEISAFNDLSNRVEIGKNEDEISRLGITLNKMLERLEKSFNNEKQFTQDASHELRTPISVILSQCEFSLENAKSKEDYIEALEVIQKQGNKMAALINELLNFTRLDNMQNEKKFEHINISELLDIVCDELIEINSKDISLKKNIEDNIYADVNSSLMARLYINIISNAYKYGKDLIEVNLYRSKDNVVFSVKDNGIGISEDDKEKIFKRFYRCDKSRSSEDGSMGLGLAMADYIAKYHSGAINVISTLGNGSTFIFSMKY